MAELGIIVPEVLIGKWRLDTPSFNKIHNPSGETAGGYARAPLIAPERNLIDQRYSLLGQILHHAQVPDNTLLELDWNQSVVLAAQSLDLTTFHMLAWLKNFDINAKTKGLTNACQGLVEPALILGPHFEPLLGLGENIDYATTNSWERFVARVKPHFPIEAGKLGRLIELTTNRKFEPGVVNVLDIKEVASAATRLSITNMPNCEDQEIIIRATGYAAAELFMTDQYRRNRIKPSFVSPAYHHLFEKG